MLHAFTHDILTTEFFQKPLHPNLPLTLSKPFYSTISHCKTSWIIALLCPSTYSQEQDVHGLMGNAHSQRSTRRLYYHVEQSKLKKPGLNNKSTKDTPTRTRVPNSYVDNLATWQFTAAHGSKIILNMLNYRAPMNCQASTSD